MALPLFDPIALPPNVELVDVNSLEEPERTEYQALALEAWVESAGGTWVLDPRDWSDNEGMFIVRENGETIGVAIVLDVEGL